MFRGLTQMAMWLQFAVLTLEQIILLYDATHFIHSTDEQLDY